MRRILQSIGKPHHSFTKHDQPSSRISDNYRQKEPGTSKGVGGDSLRLFSSLAARPGMSMILSNSKNPLVCVCVSLSLALSLSTLTPSLWLHSHMPSGSAFSSSAHPSAWLAFVTDTHHHASIHPVAALQPGRTASRSGT